MEKNMPVIARKVWHIMRFAFFMLRKGSISKKKLLLDLNLMMKRGKIAGKALSNLMFHHHHNQRGTTLGGSHLHYTTATDLREFEFSCSNTPLYRHYFPTKRKQNQQKEFMTMPFSFAEYEDIIDNSSMEAVNKVLEMMASNDVVSPCPSDLPDDRFGFTPMPVKKLRITDSPFPVQDFGEDDHNHVDKAAEEFIQRFYSQLKHQI